MSNTPELAELVNALTSQEELRIEGDWLVGDTSFSGDMIDEDWAACRELLGAIAPGAVTIKRVIFFDDGVIEELGFLSNFTHLEELVLYGNTLIGDADALAGHPRLARVALTNYSSLSTPAKLSWLDELPALDELVYFSGYFDHAPLPLAPSTAANLRSLWTTLETFLMLDLKGPTRLERLTLDIADARLFSKRAERARAKFEEISSARSGPAPGVIRIMCRADADERQRILEVTEGWFAPETSVEWSWHGRDMETLHRDAFLHGEPLFPL